MRVLLKRNVLEEWITRNNVSYRQVALDTGLSSGYISQLCNHTRYPSGKTRQKLMDYTGLSFDTLFCIMPDFEGGKDE